jgi:hypothetical protein
VELFLVQLEIKLKEIKIKCWNLKITKPITKLKKIANLEDLFKKTKIFFKVKITLF